MGDYSEEYRKYYQELKSKANIKEKGYEESPKEEPIILNQKYDVYPNTSSSYRGTYIKSYPGNYQGNYRGNYRGTGMGYNNRNQEIPKVNRYVRGVIIRLTGTALLFISVLALKVMPYEQARGFYEKCKVVVSENFNYLGFMETIKKFGGETAKEVQGKIDELQKGNMFDVSKDEDDVQGFKEEGQKENVDNINNKN